MKRVMLMMVLAALLLTQCKKPSIEFPTPSVTTTVSMTITAGPGSKTDITTEEGRITWSEGDKIYVGDGSKYIGCLSIVSGVGNATGTFTGDVTATAGDDCTFHFYYLGSTAAPDVDATEVTIDFSSQDIYADGGKLKNASGQHVGYGKAEHVKVEADKPVTGLQVSMKSKVAIAYFCFQKGEGESATQYTGALTLSGEHIYNKMTVKFNESDFSFSGTKGNIRLTNTRTLKYAMLVPTGSTAEETLNFGGGATGATTLANGIEANKFYRIDSRDPIVVEVTPFVFSVASGTTVEFSPGNLWYGKAEGEDEPAFHFEGSQAYNATESFVANHIDRFYWSKTESVAYMEGDYSDAGAQTTDVFFTNDPLDNTKPNTGFQVSGETAGTWRTLSSEEWRYLLNIGGSSGRTDKNRFAKANVNGVNGLLIFPDRYNNDVKIPNGSIPGVAGVNDTGAGYPTNSIPADTWAAMESFGVVFLPAAGVGGTTSVWYRNKNGNYNSSDLTDGGVNPYNMTFTDTNVQSGVGYYRYYRESVRLVRSCPAL